MGFAERLLSKLFKRKESRLKDERGRDKADPANVLYETFEHGCKHEEEKNFSVCQMKHTNEL